MGGPSMFSGLDIGFRVGWPLNPPNMGGTQKDEPSTWPPLAVANAFQVLAQLGDHPVPEQSQWGSLSNLGSKTWLARHFFGGIPLLGGKGTQKENNEIHFGGNKKTHTHTNQFLSDDCQFVNSEYDRVCATSFLNSMTPCNHPATPPTDTFGPPFAFQGRQPKIPLPPIPGSCGHTARQTLSEEKQSSARVNGSSGVPNPSGVKHSSLAGIPHQAPPGTSTCNRSHGFSSIGPNPPSKAQFDQKRNAELGYPHWATCGSLLSHFEDPTPRKSSVNKLASLWAIGPTPFSVCRDDSVRLSAAEGLAKRGC